MHTYMYTETDAPTHKFTYTETYTHARTCRGGPNYKKRAQPPKCTFLKLLHISRFQITRPHPDPLSLKLELLLLITLQVSKDVF